MKSDRIKLLLKENWLYYLAGIGILAGMKLFYRQADCNALQWILAPTQRWVQILSGLHFEYEPHAGYVNYHLRFIIAPSCSGLQFMIVSIATLLFSFIHYMENRRQKLTWIALSAGISYLFTILINGLRIILSIYLLPILQQSIKIVTGQQLHTITGIIIYFTSLIVLHTITWQTIQAVSHATPCTLFSKPAWKLGPPIFWYFAIVLGIPFLHREYLQAEFRNYALLIAIVCTVILLLFYLTNRIFQFLKNSKKNS